GGGGGAYRASGGGVGPSEWPNAADAAELPVVLRCMLPDSTREGQDGDGVLVFWLPASGHLGHGAGELTRLDRLRQELVEPGRENPVPLEEASMRGERDHGQRPAAVASPRAQLCDEAGAVLAAHRHVTPHLLPL